MKIGLDLSVIQTPHRMRGIGATAINFINHLPDETKQAYEFVIFLYEESQDEALEILDLKGVRYEVRTLKKPERIDLSLPSKLKKINGPLNSIKSMLSRGKGDQRIAKDELSDLDTYLQFDQMQIPPRRRGLKTLVILYDLIPYILESDYLWTYKTGRKNGDSRKSSLRKDLLRRQYLSQVKAVCKYATKLVAISHHTKLDFIKYAGVPPKKIEVVHLGVEDMGKVVANRTKPVIQEYLVNSWGYIRKPIDLSTKPFLLFVGGADPRRRLTDLVAAYNNLKARGHDIRLVLAGDTMKGVSAVPVRDIQDYLRQSAYLDDIVFLGFVTDDQKRWLYENALAFVYPSVYEGFGLPVLEAMQYGTPVITYNNSSIDEIAGEAAIYAKDAEDIQKESKRLLTNNSSRNKYSALGRKQTAMFPWGKTTSEIFHILTTD